MTKNVLTHKGKTDIATPETFGCVGCDFESCHSNLCDSFEEKNPSCIEFRREDRRNIIWLKQPKVLSN